MNGEKAIFIAIVTGAYLLGAALGAAFGWLVLAGAVIVALTLALVAKQA